jgi:TRAP-type C4-dicarboxylate transport system permease small subunit
MKTLMAWFDRIVDGMIFLAGVILVFIMLSVCLEVILRYFLNRPQMWVTEVTEVLLLYITFLGTTWLLRQEGHVKVDIILNRLKPKTLALLGILSSAIGFFVSITLTISGFQLTWDYLQRGIYTPTAMEIPVSIIIVIIPVGSLMLLIQFIRRGLLHVAGLVMETEKSKAR